MHPRKQFVLTFPQETRGGRGRDAALGIKAGAQFFGGRIKDVAVNGPAQEDTE